MTWINRNIAALILIGGISVGNSAAANENVMVVFDGSNSMWGQIDGTAKIEIARSVMENLLGEWSNDREVGLMAYGHRRRGDCTDIETLVTAGHDTRTEILERINSITPTGKTPLTDAVEQAANALSFADQPATVVLISDGLESCERDPCALAEALEKGGVGFTAHVVGFGLAGDEDTASLSCIAEKTGGKYIQANNAAELGQALNVVSSAVAEAPQPEPEPEPKPKALPVTVGAPKSAVGGTEIKVSWAPTIAESDYITIVPVGTDEGEFGQYVRIGKNSEVLLQTPGSAGLYEVRYVQQDGSATLGMSGIELTEPQVSLSGPDTVTTGAEFKVAWTPTINRRDYVTIVPAGTDEGEFGNYAAVSKNSETRLRAPADTGLYELRYVLNVDKRTVASLPIEVINPTVTLQAPDHALTGAAFEVSWTGAVNKQDYVTIVPMGADEGEFGNYFTVGENDRNNLKAPAETGMYEVRYVLREGNKTMARASIEITQPEVTISAPQSVLAGSSFSVAWTGGVDKADYITIVPMGSDEGEFGNYLTIRDKAESDLKAPAETGMYEVRYVLREGNKTMARQTVEVTQPSVTLTAPAEIRTGDTLRIGWTTAVDKSDYITLVPMGSDEDVYGEYFTVRDKAQYDMTAPAETGMYELRYVLREGGKVLTRLPIEVLTADSSLESGASLTAPETASPGSTIEVGWSVEAESADQRITLAHGNQAIFTWLQAVKTAGSDPVQITLPNEPGVYELRFLDVTNQAVLARKIIKVE